MSNLRSFINTWVQDRVAEQSMETRYRPPLLGFADAADDRFLQLRQIAGPTHLLPADLMPEARSVIAFFVPFAPEIVDANRAHPCRVAREWGVAYIETNALINRISQDLIAALAERGIRGATVPPTHNFDPSTLVSRWSHKSVAAVAGLGGFGLYHMLITEAGCAGRFGSVVVDATLEPTSPPAGPLLNRCAYYDDQGCTVCVDRCPTGALTELGLDKQLCYRWLLHTADRFQDLGVADVCGKCATGPCALAPAAGVKSALRAGIDRIHISGDLSEEGSDDKAT